MARGEERGIITLNCEKESDGEKALDNQYYLHKIN